MTLTIYRLRIHLADALEVNIHGESTKQHRAAQYSHDDNDDDGGADGSICMVRCGEQRRRREGAGRGAGRAKDGGRARTRQGIIEWEGKVREGQGDKGREEEEGKVGTAYCKGRGGVEARKRA